MVDDAPALFRGVYYAQTLPLEIDCLCGANTGDPSRYPAGHSKRPIIRRSDDSNLRRKGADAFDRGGEYIHVDIRRREHHRPDPLCDYVAVPVVNLTHRLHGQHRSDAVRDDMEAADSGAGDQPGEHLFQGVTRPHGALAVIT